MPTIPKAKNFAASTIAIMNAIRGEASPSYQERIPIATQENFRAAGDRIMEFEATQNEFITALYNRIGRVIITSKEYTNPLRVFKRGMLEYGETIEELFVNIATAHQYNPAVAEKTVFKREKPDVGAAFHTLNLTNFYKTTIERDQLKRAFLSVNGLTELIAAIMQSLYTGSELDEFLMMKQIIVENANKGRMAFVQVDAPTKANAEDFIIQLKAVSNDMQFMKGKYNYAGVTTRTPLESQYLILDSKVSALIDVSVLAAAFNMSKAEFLGHQILIDDFGALTGAVALLVDKDWFMVVDNDREFNSIFNPEGRYWNYFYHVWKTFSASPFCNAILFTSNPIGNITAVEIAGPETIKAGMTYKYVPNVTASGLILQTLKWDISGNSSDNTYVDGQGNLQVGFDETGPTITLKATSTERPTVSGTLELTVG